MPSSFGLQRQRQITNDHNGYINEKGAALGFYSCRRYSQLRLHAR